MQLTGFSTEQQGFYEFLRGARRKYPDWAYGLVHFHQAKRERLRRVVARRTGVLDARVGIMQCGQCPVWGCKLRER